MIEEMIKNDRRTANLEEFRQKDKAVSRVKVSENYEKDLSELKKWWDKEKGSWANTNQIALSPKGNGS